MLSLVPLFICFTTSLALQKKKRKTKQKKQRFLHYSKIHGTMRSMLLEDVYQFVS